MFLKNERPRVLAQHRSAFRCSRAQCAGTVLTSTMQKPPKRAVRCVEVGRIELPSEKKLTGGLRGVVHLKIVGVARKDAQNRAIRSTIPTLRAVPRAGVHESDDACRMLLMMSIRRRRLGREGVSGLQILHLDR